MITQVRLDRIGETNRAKNGMMMTIVAYRTTTDLDVRFENGVLVEHRAYKEFCLGKIGCPGYGKYRGSQHIGETNRATNGQMMTIINWCGKTFCDVQFEDGTVVKHKRYGNFRDGSIPNPNFTVDDYRVQLRTGKTNRANNGLMMTIIRYIDANHVDIQFEDGVIVKNKLYLHFLKGNIKHPNINVKLIDRTGEHKLSKQGIDMEITKYPKGTDVTLTFATGYVAEHKNYYNFLSGRIGHPFPYSLGDISMDKPAYIYAGVGNFYCHCTKCGLEEIMSIKEMKEHVCQ